MQVTRIVALRHGETAWNVDTRIQGQLDIGLNAQGRWQAERAAQALADDPLDAIYSSDLERAWVTAATLAQGQARTPPLRPHLGLRERHFGSLQGLTWQEIETLHPEHASRWRGRDPEWSPPGGESLLQLRERVARTVAELAAAHVGQHIALVAHGGVLDVLYRLATGQETQAPRTWHLGNAAINRLLWTPEGLRLVGWGDVGHLEAEGPRDEL
ncbi:MAG: histidine phosphatase family protein [Limnohabitans sp.]|jgi:probable phosphoglycerate mutase|nr:histidine phosphatase family protein [Limnohabitans sp.]